MFILAFYFLTNTLRRQTLSIKSLEGIDEGKEKLCMQEEMHSAKRLDSCILSSTFFHFRRFVQMQQIAGNY